MIDAEKARAIAKKYYEDVFLYCYSIVNCDKYEAEVLTQEVFLFFQEKCDILDDELILRWLLVVAKNKSKEYFRQKGKDAVLVPLDTSLSGSTISDYEEIFKEQFPDSDEEIQKYISIIIKALTKQEQDLYRRLYIEKKSHKEIADELNLKENTVSKRASRLKTKIKRMISLIFSSAGQFLIKIFLIF